MNVQSEFPLRYNGLSAMQDKEYTHKEVTLGFTLTKEHVEEQVKRRKLPTDFWDNPSKYVKRIERTLETLRKCDAG